MISTSKIDLSKLMFIQNKEKYYSIRILLIQVSKSFPNIFPVSLKKKSKLYFSNSHLLYPLFEEKKKKNVFSFPSDCWHTTEQPGEHIQSLIFQFQVSSFYI